MQSFEKHLKRKLKKQLVSYIAVKERINATASRKRRRKFSNRTIGRRRHRSVEVLKHRVKLLWLLIKKARGETRLKKCINKGTLAQSTRSQSRDKRRGKRETTARALRKSSQLSVPRQLIAPQKQGIFVSSIGNL